MRGRRLWTGLITFTPWSTLAAERNASRLQTGSLRASGISEYIVLFSEKEYKKISARI